jgi:ribosomal protein L21
LAKIKNFLNHTSIEHRRIQVFQEELKRCTLSLKQAANNIKFMKAISLGSKKLRETSAIQFLSDGENTSIGQPVLDNVAVKGHIVEQGKEKKIIVFKFKRRKRYRRKQGHRQQFTAIKIDQIEA